MAQSAWIFKTLVQFGFQSQVLGFGIRTSLQCKSVLVCENTKTESIYLTETPSHSTCADKRSGCCPPLP